MAEENESEQSGTSGRPAVKLGVKKLTAIIIAVVVVALAGIGGGYAYWTHHETNAYHEAGSPSRERRQGAHEGR